MILLVSLCAIFFLWISFKWIKIKSYWAEQNVPFLPPHPVFGSLTFLPRQNINIWLREIYNEFKGPYFGVWFFWRPALVVNSPLIARNILVKDSAVFRDRFVSSGNTDPLGGLNLFTLKEPTWTNIRQKLTSVFTSSKLRTLQGYLNIKGKELVERIRNENKSRIDLRSMFSDYTTDIIGSYAFGVNGNATATGEGVLRDVTKEFMKYSLFRAASWISIFFFPKLVDIFRFKYFPRCTIGHFKRIFRTVASQREVSHNEANDLLDVLLKIRNENTNEEYSEDFVIAQAAIMLLGGFDGTGTILTLITYELAYNEDVQEKVYQELLEAKQRTGSEHLDYQALSEAVYLNSVIKECLRKYVSVGWLDRIAASDYKIDDNLTIKAGTPVYINMTGMHFDPDYFPDPNKFDPDRFMPDNVKKIVPYTFLPFGEGPRICIGKRFGLISVRFALSSVLLNYKIRKFDDCPTLAEVKTEKRGLFLSPGEPLHVNFVPRL